MHPVSPLQILTVSDESIALAVEYLRHGKLVSFPTETVYGLGADATSKEATASIYTTKGRPSNNPLIIHVKSLEDAQLLGVFNEAARSLTEKYWPGPLTIVVPIREGAKVYPAPHYTVDTIAIRCPSHPVSYELLHAFGKPIAAPSANRSGRISATKAIDVYDDFKDAPGNLALILDGGDCPEGIESTIVDCTNVQPVVLRHGSIILDELSIDSIKTSELTSTSGMMRSPGLLSSHYAPSLPVRINASHLKEGEVLLGFGSAMDEIATHGLNLSPEGDLEEAAHNLYSYLRQLDIPRWKGIAVMPIPDEGLGKAINDRLRRASAPR